MVFYALKELASAGDHKELSAILRKNMIEDRDIEKALKLISKTGARQESRLLEEECINKAKESLQGMPKNKCNEFLRLVADFVVERNR